MNALFYIKLFKSYIQANYRNYTGKVNMKVHDNLILSTQLETGQIEGICKLINESNLPVVQLEFKNHIPQGI